MISGIRVIDQLSQLGDVLFSNLQNNNVLIYDLSSEKWKNGTISVSGGSVELSKTFSYNIDGQLYLISDAQGTKTFQYNVDGTLHQIVGTGVYVSKLFEYDVDGRLSSITIL